MDMGQDVVDRQLDGTPQIDRAVRVVASFESKIRQAQSMRRRCRRAPTSRSSFAGFRFPTDVIVIAVRWYLRYGLSYRDVEELLAERGITVDHATVYRRVQRFTPLLERSTSMASSSTYWCRRSGTWRPLAGSLPGLWLTAATRVR